MQQWRQIPIKKWYDKATLNCLLFETLQVLVSAPYLHPPPPLHQLPLSPNLDEHTQLQNLPWFYYDYVAENLQNQPGLTDEQRAKQLKTVMKDFEQRPLVGSRGSYLHMWCEDCPVGPQWAPKEQVSMKADVFEDFFSDSSEQLTTIHDLKVEFDAHVQRKEEERLAFGNPLDDDPKPRYSLTIRKRFLVARILAKSRLFYFGKNDKDDSYPYRFSLRIIDVSNQETNVEFWSVTCPALYSSLEPGAILKLGGLRLRRVYHAIPVPMVSLVTGDDFSPTFEISYSPVKAPGSPRSCAILVGTAADWFSSKISRASAPVFVDDLVASYSLNRSSSMLTAQALADALSSLSMTSALKSVVGFVAAILPLERVSFFDSHLLTRWICLVSTDTEASPLMIQLAANSEVQNLENLKFGQRVLLTHLRMEVHHKQLIGISSIYTHIKVLENWAQAQPEDENKQHKINRLVRGPFLTELQMPYTIRCNSPMEYADLYGAKLYAQPTFKELAQHLRDPLPLVRHNRIILGRMEYNSFLKAEDYSKGTTGYQTKATVIKVIEKGSAIAKIDGKLADFLFIAISSPEGEAEEAASSQKSNSRRANANSNDKDPNSVHYYCVLLPLTPIHLCHGDTAKMLTLSEQDKPFIQWLVRDYHIVKRTYQVLVGVSVFNTGDDVVHTMNNTWRDAAKSKKDVPLFDFS